MAEAPCDSLQMCSPWSELHDTGAPARPCSWRYFVDLLKKFDGVDPAKRLRCRRVDRTLLLELGDAAAALLAVGGHLLDAADHVGLHMYVNVAQILPYGYVLLLADVHPGAAASVLLIAAMDWG